MNLKALIRKLARGPALRGLETTFRTGRGLFWQTRYGFPARGMRVIAITGTNGKTTTASYINKMLQSASQTTAVLTTAYYEINGEYKPNRTHQTIDKQSIVQKFFNDARAAGVDWVILEVTSHALDQGRIDGVAVEIAVMTNLTQEHLDYHRTMERYAAAKARLFGARYKTKWSILNADDPWFNYFSDRSTGSVISYGENPKADLRLTTYDLSGHGSSLTARYGKEHLAFTSKLIGKFNAYNALAAYGVGIAAGLDKKIIGEGIATLESVAGRMEQVNAGQKFNVIVDYAYTPDALENVLTALQEITKGKVIIVFGATGDRDKTKRAPMGAVVAKRADRIFLTDDETYSEDPTAIRQQVYEGIKQAKAEAKTTIVDDRRSAIQQAFAAAKPADTVLLTGIGHQDYRDMGGRHEPWDEREVAREEIAIISQK
ncbi:MAG: UDP-N-acetylmuramoyl-L-alanyl-D-glutamate--2,6-diaminopimelate ligase [Candidatus Saccharimonadales bacterium]